MMRVQGTLRVISAKLAIGHKISPSQKISGTTSKKNSHQRPLIFTSVMRSPSNYKERSKADRIEGAFRLQVLRQGMMPQALMISK